MSPLLKLKKAGSRPRNPNGTPAVAVKTRLPTPQPVNATRREPGLLVQIPPKASPVHAANLDLVATPASLTRPCSWRGDFSSPDRQLSRRRNFSAKPPTSNWPAAVVGSVTFLKLASAI